MKKQKTACRVLVASTAFLFAITPKTIGQTAEALMDALVRKGILTEQEAEDIKSDVAKENRQYNKITVGSTTMKLNFYGDVRGRFEHFSSENDAFVDRNRFRYRLRFGVTATLLDDFEAGFRLTSSEAATGNGYTGTGGDPISGNTTFNNNGEKKFIFVDAAYGRWTPLKGPHLTGGITVGKMDNPFVFSDMVFDGDYTPEGAAIQTAYRFNDVHTAKLSLGGFVLDEIGGAGDDPYLLGAQSRWDAVWSPKFQTSFGVAWLAICNQDFLGNAAVPNVNRGNTRELFVFPAGTTNMVPTASFGPVVLDASATYTLNRAPLYPGPFPIKIGGDYMNNCAGSGGTDTYAYSAGVTFGKAGKRRTWEIGYTYKWLGADAWWEELVDSDSGAFYQVQQANAGFSGSGAGYGAGTNVKGHIFRFAYSLSDSMTLGVKWLMTELINEVPAASESGMNRLQVDASWKF